MSGPHTAPPPVELTADLIRLLFEDLSAHLREVNSANHHMTIVGGAALALRWGDRATQDVDLLDHRRRWRRRPAVGERHTPAVDFISMRFPAEVFAAADLVADRHSLPVNWLNQAAGLFTPRCPLEPEVLYRSDMLTVESPGPRVLLAMKLAAGRDKDLEDAARLVRETGITEPERLAGLVVAAYGPDAATARTARFAAAARDHPEARPAPSVDRGYPPASTCPWGSITSETEVAPGVVAITTRGHGGLRLSDERWEELPVDVAASFRDAGWAEQDAEAPIALAVLGVDPRPHFAWSPAQYRAHARLLAAAEPLYAAALAHLDAGAEHSPRPEPDLDIDV